jgi:mono/diheme cytochrome c family protein
MKTLHLIGLVGWFITAFALTVVPPALRADEAQTTTATVPSAERGEKLLLGRSFIPPIWTFKAYENLWKQWDRPDETRPADYQAAVIEHYGLHPAPYPNHGIPMGLRKATGLLGLGVTVDCMVCHGGSIARKTYVGLGNASLDVEALFSDLSRADGLPGRLPHTFTNVRGTSEAVGMAVFLLGFREPDLTLRMKPLDLDLHDDLCSDPPAWWLLKKKKTMYYTAGSDARSVRSLMQFMMTPLNPSDAFPKEEKNFADIQAYMLTLKPPAYPLPIDRTLATRGEHLFKQTCARCHGSYGEHWTYPNRVIPIDEIGTDRRRFDGLTTKFGEYYQKTWFGKEVINGVPHQDLISAPVGYQAPPLDGIWATAPYLHNGSVPTVYQVLNSKARPNRYTRSFKTSLDDYDPVRLGWKYQLVPPGDDSTLKPFERRKIYDTSLSGRANTGHTFGDDLTDAERFAIIEYLKTL